MYKNYEIHTRRNVNDWQEIKWKKNTEEVKIKMNNIITITMIKEKTKKKNNNKNGRKMINLFNNKYSKTINTKKKIQIKNVFFVHSLPAMDSAKCASALTFTVAHAVGWATQRRFIEMADIMWREGDTGTNRNKSSNWIPGTFRLTSNKPIFVVAYFSESVLSLGYFPWSFWRVAERGRPYYSHIIDTQNRKLGIYD